MLCPPLAGTLAIPIFGFFHIEQNLWLKAYQTSCEKAIYFKIVWSGLAEPCPNAAFVGRSSGGRRRVESCTAATTCVRPFSPPSAETA
jgi:hypothetical protein